VEYGGGIEDWGWGWDVEGCWDMGDGLGGSEEAGAGAGVAF
jgi:hypothetical protein